MRVNILVSVIHSMWGLYKVIYIKNDDAPVLASHENLIHSKSKVTCPTVPTPIQYDKINNCKWLIINDKCRHIIDSETLEMWKEGIDPIDSSCQ